MIHLKVLDPKARLFPSREVDLAETRLVSTSPPLHDPLFPKPPRRTDGWLLAPRYLLVLFRLLIQSAVRPLLPPEALQANDAESRLLPLYLEALRSPFIGFLASNFP